jgi:pimeloyl-ACP methyl ester carboxylesterase
VSENGLLSSVVVTGDGPALLLLHGGPGLNDYMGILDDEVAGWRAIRYQQRGLPPSPSAGPFTVDQHIADLVSVVDSLELDHVVVLGHSWGGHLALQAAITIPERVRALVLVDALGSAGDGGASGLSAELLARLSPQASGRAAMLAESLSDADASPEAAKELAELLWPSYFADPPAAPPLPADFGFSPQCNAETLASVFPMIQDGSFAAKLASVDVPVQIVLGERSPLPHSAGQATAELLPRSDLVVVPGAGHLPWYEQPGCIRSALSRVSDALPD